MDKQKLSIDKETLDRLYNVEKMSYAQIARMHGSTKSHVADLMDAYGIKARSTSEAKKVTDSNVFNEKQEEAINSIKQKIGYCEPTPTEFVPVVRKNMLIPIPVDGKARNAVITLVISDLHIGDCDHLPQSYWSCVTNAIEVIKNIKGLYKVKELNVVLNGDITNGTDIYRYQELRNLIQRPHWQIFVTEMIIKDTYKKLSELIVPNETVLVKGTHDTHSSNLAIYLKRLLPGKTGLVRG